MIVCLDTNVLIQARASRHAFGVLLDSLAFGLMDLAVFIAIWRGARKIRRWWL